MSFIGAVEQGLVYAPGWFLAHEECERKTRQMAQAGATTAANGGKYIPMGTIWPSNDQYAKGIVYEDVDVTSGDMPGSVVLKGVVYEDRLPVALDSDAKTALIAAGFVFKTEPIVRRPGLEALTVASVAGTAAGDTKITVSGFAPAADEGYAYKVGNAAEDVAYGDDLSAWTSWDGSDDITAASDKVITVAVVDADDLALAAGSATVVAKA